jgi:MFS family permease
LRIRNFRYYFAGQLISQIGTWIQTVAQGWLVLRLSHNNGAALGIVTSLQFTPTLFAGAWAGVLADRVDKRRLLIITQALSALFTGILAALVVTDAVQLWMVYLLSFLLGTATTFDTPARQAFASEMVAPDDLTNAVSLNSMVFNVSRIVGPAIAGIVIAVASVGACFVLNAVSFLAAIAGLWLIRPAELHLAPPVARAKGQVREGFTYAWRTPELRRAFLVIALVGTFAFGSFLILGPLLAKIAFHGNAGTYGAMTSVLGAGSLVGSLVAASRSRPTPLLTYGSCIGLGVLTLATAAAPTLALELPLLGLTGIVFMVFLSAMTSNLQLTSLPSMRGRVMALWALLTMGSTPIGGPIIGFAAEHFGPRVGYSIGGVAAVVAGSLALAVPMLRGRGTEPTVNVVAAGQAPVGAEYSSLRNRL